MKIVVRVRKYLLFFFLFVNTYWLGEENKDGCVECHKVVSPKVIMEYKGSIHGEREIDCVSCHRGKKDTDDENSAHSGEFKGRFSKKEIAILCDKCHSDANIVKLRHLETDIYKQYLLSKHGKLLMEKNDQKVAVCSDCHGSHDILSKKNPLSRTFKSNIAKMCAKCHSDKEYMKEYNIPVNQYEEYTNGIHGQILSGKIDSKNYFLVPTCSDCHGSHGATAVEVTQTHQICGTCHFDVYQYFKVSIHFNALQRTGKPKCIDCHGNHKNTLPPAGLLLSNEAGSCGSCHKTDENKKVFEIAQSLQNKISDTLRILNNLEEMIKTQEYSQEKGISEVLHTNLEKVRILLSKLRKSSHSLDLKLLEDHYNEITTINRAVMIFKEKYLAKERVWTKSFVFLLLFIFLSILLIISILVAIFIAKKFKRNIYRQ